MFIASTHCRLTPAPKNPVDSSTQRRPKSSFNRIGFTSEASQNGRPPKGIRARLHECTMISAALGGVWERAE